MVTLASLPNDLRLFAKYHLKRRVVTYPAPETELGVVPLGFEAEAYEAALRASSPDVEVETIANVLYDGRKHPVHRARWAPEGATARLLILAGVHGNEHAGILAVPDALKAVIDAGSTGVEVVALTPVNAVGATEVSRYNGEGYDINRDFVRFDTEEARLVRDEIARARPDFVLSLHEGPQDASFMFTNRFIDDALAGRLLDSVARGGTVLAEHDYLGRRLPRPGLAPMGRVVHAINRLWAASLEMMHTNMYADRLGIPEITWESSWRGEGPERIRGHVDLVLAVVEALGAGAVKRRAA